MSAPANAGKPWGPRQDDQLVRLARAGKSVAEVADLMGRTHAGIVARADRLSYRLTATDQYTLLRTFIGSARNASSAATTPATHGVPEAIEGAQSGTLGLQACPGSDFPLLLEVHTEKLCLVMHALEAAGFDVKCRPNLPSRYVVRDTQNAGECV